MALALLISPWKLVAAIFFSALLHEGGHLLFLDLFGVSADRFRLTLLGAEICADGTAHLSYGRELLVVCAGPATNLLCALLTSAIAFRTGWQDGYLLAGAHALLGVFNLLPILPLDGGRALQLIVSYFFTPPVGDLVAAWVGIASALALVVCGAYIFLALHGGVLFLLTAVGLFLGIFPQLRLAKRGTGV